MYSTGETPWVKSIIDKYHETAKSNGAIVSLPYLLRDCRPRLTSSRSSHPLGLRVHQRIFSPGLLSRPFGRNSTPTQEMWCLPLKKLSMPFHLFEHKHILNMDAEHLELVVAPSQPSSPSSNHSHCPNSASSETPFLYLLSPLPRAFPANRSSRGSLASGLCAIWARSPPAHLALQTWPSCTAAAP